MFVTSACDSDVTGTTRFLLVITTMCAVLTLVVHCGPHEERLIHDIFKKRKYEKLARPVEKESEAVDVQFGLSLQQIIEVDEKNEMLHTNMWLNYQWRDYKLSWNETDYGGISNIRLPSTHIWTPDILLYNSADEDIDSKFPTNIVVYSSGDVSWIPIGLYISACNINIQWFPFDDQECKMKFGSWTYDGTKINLTASDDKIDISTYQISGEWELIDVPAKHSVNYYDCCVEPYVDITFTIHIRRRTLYYGFNLIIPCALTSMLTLLTFILPPGEGEKIGLGITILLSLSVFQLIVADMVPSTSMAVPLVGLSVCLSVCPSVTSIFSSWRRAVACVTPTNAAAAADVAAGIYFACVMIMCTISVIMTVIVLNFHHRSPDMYEMPIWVKRLVCEWLAWALRMSRPGRDLSRRFLQCKARMRDLEAKTPPSVSLIANVKDVDNAIPINDFNVTAGFQQRSLDGSSSRVQVNYNNLHGGGVISTSAAMTGARNELLAILSELRYITKKMKDDLDNEEETNDWKFAAMVVDRLCFWIFSLYLIATTVAIFSSPAFSKSA